jgi:hypothetical protein
MAGTSEHCNEPSVFIIARNYVISFSRKSLLHGDCKLLYNLNYIGLCVISAECSHLPSNSGEQWQRRGWAKWVTAQGLVCLTSVLVCIEIAFSPYTVAVVCLIHVLLSETDNYEE